METGNSGPKERRSRAPYFQWVFQRLRGHPLSESPPGEAGAIVAGKVCAPGRARRRLSPQGRADCSVLPRLGQAGSGGKRDAGDRRVRLAGVTVQRSVSIWDCEAQSTRPSFPQVTAVRARPEPCAPPLPGPAHVAEHFLQRPFPPAPRLAGCSTWCGSSRRAGEKAARFVDGAKAWLM